MDFSKEESKFKAKTAREPNKVEPKADGDTSAEIKRSAPTAKPGAKPAEPSAAAAPNEESSIAVTAALAAAAGVITYFVLAWTLPIEKELASTDTGISSEQVFGGDIDNPGQASSAAPEPASAAIDESGSALAEADATESDVNASASAEGALSQDDTAADVASSAPAYEEPEPAVEPPPAPEISSAAEPEPEYSEPASSVGSTSSNDAPAPRRTSAADKRSEVVEKLNTAWWPAKLEGKLNILFVGAAEFDKAIAVLTDGSFDNANSANQNLSVRTLSGRKIEGTWKVSAANKGMLVFDTEPGVYSVNIESRLVDKQGRPFQRHARGPVSVK